ncbi:MAG: hypothetical protein ACPL1F_03150 [bacterium]|jgi:hypothetical protein
MLFYVFFKDFKNNKLIQVFEKPFWGKEIALENLIKFLLKIYEKIEDIYIKEDEDIIEINIPNIGLFYITKRRDV